MATSSRTVLVAGLCVLAALVAPTQATCSNNTNCEECAKHAACYYCQSTAKCHAIVGVEQAACSVTDSYWMSCNINSLVVALLTFISFLAVVVSCVCMCCWCSRRCRQRRVNGILRDQSRANAEAAERHAQHAQQRTERAAAADRIRVRYGIAPTTGPSTYEQLPEHN